MKHEDLQYLLVDLPGDIRRLKDAGEFSHMRRVIEMRLSGEKLTEPMRKRLELELAMTQMLDAAYPYSAEEAAALAAGSIRDFTPAELEHYRDLDAADWIYVDAQVRYRQNFLANLIKTRPELEARVLDEKRLNYQHSDRDMLEKMMAKMREKGGAAVKFRIRASVQVKPEAYRPGKKIRVQIPVPVEGSQMKDVRILKISPEPAHVAAPDYPQRTVCFEGVYPQETVFQVEYEYVNRMRYVKPDPARVSASQPRFYTEELPPHIVFKPYIRMLASQIVGQETNPLIKARKIFDYVTTVPTYSFMPPYFCVEDLPGFMATRLKGDCGVFSLLFITLCRAAGVPARWQSGLYTTPLEIGCHDWSQFYVAPYGWMYVDGSFGNSAHRNGNEARRDFYFGNLDPYRMVAATEFQHEFDPPMDFMRYDPYDNQEGEAEYEDGGLHNSQIYTDQEMLEIQELDD